MFGDDAETDERVTVLILSNQKAIAVKGRALLGQPEFPDSLGIEVEQKFFTNRSEC
jgi:hypothetical protein